MNPIAVWLSIVLHVIVLALSYLNLNGIVGRDVIKDSGHTVFDFVTIGAKSKAPVLSPVNSRAGKKKSYTEEKNLGNANDDAPEKTNDVKPDTVKKDNASPPKKKEENATKKPENKTNQPKKNSESKPKTQKPKNTVNHSESKSSNSKKAHSEKNNTKSNSKKPTKSGDKALVNLSEKKKKSSGLTKGSKGAFDSIVDNALADGDYENSGLNADELGDTLTATQVDLIRETIRPCWHFPAGLKDADKLVVDIKMELDHDGYVKSANVVDKNRMNSDTGFRTAAESALRAVLDPACNPLPLPKEKYNEWKDLELSFNPRDWT